MFAPRDARGAQSRLLPEDLVIDFNAESDLDSRSYYHPFGIGRALLLSRGSVDDSAHCKFDLNDPPLSWALSTSSIQAMDCLRAIEMRRRFLARVVPLVFTRRPGHFHQRKRCKPPQEQHR